MDGEDGSILLARVAEAAERHDDMVSYMEERIRKGTPLNPEERDMFSAAFKSALSGRRTAIRAVAPRTAEEQEEPEWQRGCRLGFRSKLELELTKICYSVLELIDTVLLGGQIDCETKAFYLKMQGDYNRYMTEVSDANTRAKAVEGAKNAYAAGLQSATGLEMTHPVRLGLALNYSVFQHEVYQDTVGAIQTAKEALGAAAQHMDSVPPELRADVMVSLQLLKENLQLWEPDA